MQKVNVRCWKELVRCDSGETVEVFYSVSDFYEGRHLFIHPTCGTLFAVDPETEYYQRKNFQQLKQTLSCPVCNKSLNDVLLYPENFRCSSTGEIESHFRSFQEAPPDRTEFVLEFWDPLS
jgi:rubredoxin